MNDLDKRNERNDTHGRETSGVQRTLDRPVRTKLRLGEIARLIKKHRIIVPSPSRQTLVRWCEDGTFETVGNRPARMGWLVFEDSFWKWAREMDGCD